jgi:hypothetical protein
MTREELENMIINERCKMINEAGRDMTADDEAAIREMMRGESDEMIIVVTQREEGEL